MNGEGGCCIARYGRGGGIYGISKVDRIMLKFRPIKPKPVAGGSGSGGSVVENGDGYVKCKRGKRKYARVNRNKNKKDTFKGGVNKTVTESSSRGKEAVVTLSLLPETPDWKSNLPVTSVADQFSGMCSCKNKDKKSAPAPAWLSFDGHQKKVCCNHLGAVNPMMVKPSPPPPPPPPPRGPQVVSYVMMECVTDTSVDAKGLGCTDEERLKNMEMDTCPAFISDGQDRVVWTNKAYRQMAGVGGVDTAVVLVRKDKWTLSPVTYPAFTCKARVISAAHGHRSNLSSTSPAITLPCDVWRMDCGGYAWRLDVKAALSLGR